MMISNTSVVEIMTVHNSSVAKIVNPTSRKVAGSITDEGIGIFQLT
jgi:hypothetical protein